ncbi:hypothetical protein KM043_018499 [Ampulex compressa]|nr:hypothetical protein KM043_018499 [Ampulex compressa]
MRIYKDLFTGDEMFSDTYKMKLIDDVLYEVYGRLIIRKAHDIEIAGFNPSAEEDDEGTDETVESGVDVVLNHRLQETFAFGDKKSYTLYLKDYMKKLVAKLEETAPDQVEIYNSLLVNPWILTDLLPYWSTVILMVNLCLCLCFSNMVSKKRSSKQILDIQQIVEKFYKLEPRLHTC